MLEFINKLLAELTGFDFWFAAIYISETGGLNHEY